MAMRGNVVQFALFGKNRLMAERAVTVMSRFDLDAERVARKGR
jgi:hypothetical protein